jgi:hypothetical protein
MIPKELIPKDDVQAEEKERNMVSGKKKQRRKSSVQIAVDAMKEVVEAITVAPGESYDRPKRPDDDDGWVQQ